jgi:hypothetical protein
MALHAADLPQPGLGWPSRVFSRRSTRHVFLSCATVAGGFALAFGAHLAISSEQIGDGASLMLAGGVVAGLAAGATGATWRMLRRPSSRLPAAAVLCVGLLAAAAWFVAATGRDISVVSESLLQTEDDPTPPATLAVGADGTDVRLSGELSEGVATRLAALLAHQPAITRIHLTSEGGLADEGQALGAVIAAHGLTTFVPDYCVSACTLAFVRGRERLVLDDARLGFHAPYEEGLFGKLYRGDGRDQRAAYIRAGVDRTFVESALKVDPAGIWYPTQNQLRDANVVTAVVGHDELPDSTLDGTVTLEGAREATLREFPLTAAFRRRAPKVLDAIAAEWLAGYARDLSEAEDLDRVRAAARDAIARGLAGGDDATLIGLAHLLARRLQRTDEAEACAEIGGRADLLTAMEQAGDDAGAVSRSAGALLDRALADSRGTPDLTMNKQEFPDQQQVPQSCAAWRARYASLLHRPPATIAAVMRTIAAKGIDRALTP